MLNASTSAALLSQGIESGIQQSATLAHLKLTNKSRQMSDAQAEIVARDFESMFLSQMLGTMFGESTGDSLFGSSESKEVYKSLLMNEYGKNIAKVGGIGIASHIKRELLRMQEVQA